MNTSPILPWLAVVAVITIAVIGLRWNARRHRKFSYASVAAPSVAPTAAPGASPAIGGTDATMKGILWVLGIGALLVIVLLWATGVDHTPSRTQVQVERQVVSGGSNVTRPSDYRRVEAETHVVRNVPLEPGSTAWERVPDGYAPVPQTGLVSEPLFLLMYCKATLSGPEWLWTPEHRCVGGWIRFSVPRAPDLPEDYKMDIVYNLRWDGNRS